MMLHTTHSAALHQSCRKAAPSVRHHMVVKAAGGAAGGFGRSNKKKVDTTGGMVVPDKPFRSTTLEDLRDEAPAKKRSTAAEADAPAGFPEGVCWWWDAELGQVYARLYSSQVYPPLQPLPYPQHTLRSGSEHMQQVQTP